MLKFSTRLLEKLGKCMSIGGRQVCWAPLWQIVNNGMHRRSGEKQLLVQSSPALLE